MTAKLIQQPKAPDRPPWESGVRQGGVRRPPVPVRPRREGGHQTCFNVRASWLLSVPAPGARARRPGTPATQRNTMILANARAIHSAGEPFKPTVVEHRELRPDDVLIDIAYCGICHSDV